MRDPRDIVIRPIFTEKAVRIKDAENKYVFEVAMDSNKPEIKKAVEYTEEILKIYENIKNKLSVRGVLK